LVNTISIYFIQKTDVSDILFIDGFEKKLLGGRFLFSVSFEQIKNDEIHKSVMWIFLVRK